MELEFDETFPGPELARSRWIPHHLPHWSSRARSAARYELRGGQLHLLIDRDQPPWCPEFDGDVRVSSLQTGVRDGQHRFSPDAVVREPQREQWTYTPHYGRVETRLRALDDPLAMVALWMIGVEDVPERSAEICVCEIFGRDVTVDRAAVGMGVHPFGDPLVADDFDRVVVDGDVREFRVYTVDWEPGRIAFSVDGDVVKVVEQTIDYPMQLMLGLYEFRAGGPPAGEYPKRCVVDYVRGWR